MEFTKDLMFHIKYKQDDGVIKINKEENKKRRLFKSIKKHKLFTCICVSGVILIWADIILINNFINLLKQF